MERLTQLATAARKAAAVVLLVGPPAIAIVSGLMCAAEHVMAGDTDPTAYRDCALLVLAGFGVVSPGLPALKRSVFARR